MTVYFHGTNTAIKAKAILRAGLKPDMPSHYAAGYEPRPGRVYLTPNLTTALRYANWPTSGHWSRREADLAKHPHGFVFVTPEDRLSEIDPDEDDVGLFFSRHAEESSRPGGWVDVDGESVSIRDFRFRAPAGCEEVAPKRRVWTAIHRVLTPALMTRVSFDDGTAEAGKIALEILDRASKDALIRWTRGNVANLGPVVPTECWRFEKVAIKELTPQNFFSKAERVRSTRPHQNLPTRPVRGVSVDSEVSCPGWHRPP